jgi:basic membrane protein A
MNVRHLSLQDTRGQILRLVGLLIPVLILALLLAATIVATAASSPAPGPMSISVGLVADGPEVHDGSFNELCYAGLQRAETDLGVTGDVYTSSTPADYEPQLQQCVDDGNDLCISVGFAMADATWNMAQANPGTAFAIADVSWEEYPGNLRGIVFASEEAAYLAGTLAGLMTESDVLGDIGGMPIEPVDAFLFGYRNGARCANPNVRVLIDYTFDFVNPEVGAQKAQEMISQGADVIFAPAGGAGIGAVLTVTQSSVWGIGVDSDWYLSVFENGAVDGADKLLTSALKRMDNAVYQTIDDVLGATFASGTALYDLAGEGVGLAPFHDADPEVPQAVRDALADVEQGIKDGSIDVDDPCWSPARYVDGTGGSDDTDCLDPEQPCLSIGYAISQSQIDDVIQIAQGTYVENLQIDWPLTLEGGYSGSAAAALGDSAWTRDPERYETVIDSSATPPVAGDWDGRAVRKASVLRDGTELKMWYDGQGLFYTPQVGLATSSDGLSWTKDGANPLLGPTPGGWDEYAAELAPFVLKEDTTYKMWYEGQGEDGRRNLGYATSSDGIVWTKYGTDPVLQAGPESYDQGAAAHGTVLHEESTYRLWYHAIGDQGAIIAYATSPDGLTWTKQGPALVPEPGGWDQAALWGPSVLELDDTYWMWYGGGGPMGPAIGVVTSTDGITWDRFLSTPVVTDVNPIGDPHVITDSGKLKMWYTDYAEGVVKYAESLDGVSWTKWEAPASAAAAVMADPVLTPGDLGDPGQPVVTQNASRLVLDGLTLTGGDALPAGAVDAGGGELTVQGCTIRDNVSYWQPDAWSSAGILGGAPLTIVDSYFLNNQAESGASALRPNGELYVVNSVLAGNTGAAAIHGNAAIRLLNITLADNDSDVIFGPETGAALVMTNSILYGQLYEDLRPSCEQFDCMVNYSDVQGGWPDGTGNINLDPSFVGASNYDLNFDSLCIDAGTATGAPAYDIEGRMRDSLPDMGAYEWPPHAIYLPVLLRSFGP